MQKCGVLIGRFQPVHNGHIALIQDAVSSGIKVFKIFVGSANESHTIKNPFTFQERAAMIREALSGNGATSEQIIPLNDSIYNDTKWSVEFLNKLYKDKQNYKYVLLGYDKDETSAYLKWFPELERLEPEAITVNGHSGAAINATEIRKEFFLKGKIPNVGANIVPLSTVAFLQDFKSTTEYDYIKNEYTVVKEYKDMWKDAPYEPTFITTDAIVTTNNCILMIQRKNAPYKDKWALPGGYLGKNETIEDSMLRELVEETRIKIPRAVLKGSIKSVEVFDAPGRDPRGRLVTHAFCIPLKTGYSELPHIAGASDAAKAKWVPLAKLESMQEEISFDHYGIIQKMLGI